MKLAWLTSAPDAEAVGLFEIGIKAWRDGAFDLSAVIISSRPQSDYATEIADKAASLGLRYDFIDPEPYRARGRGWRTAYERSLTDALPAATFDLAFLAGYMLVAGDVLLAHARMLNLHPALPAGPVGTRAQVVHELVAQRCAKTGLMVHAVTPDLDRGQPIFVTELDLSDLAWHREAAELSVEVDRRIVAAEPVFISKCLSSLGAVPLEPWPPTQLHPIVIQA